MQEVRNRICNNYFRTGKDQPHRYHLIFVPVLKKKMFICNISDKNKLQFTYLSNHGQNYPQGFVEQTGEPQQKVVCLHQGDVVTLWFKLFGQYLKY